MLLQIEQYSQTLLAQEHISMEDLRRFLTQIDCTPEDIETLQEIDPAHPYGRKILLNTPKLEVMLATWTRNYPCAPHDHGGAVSAIRVLQGRSLHRLYRIENQQLTESYSEQKTAGEVIICAPNQIHSMEDDGETVPLITLHAYSASIKAMAVYDDASTVIVKGSAGAWLPPNDPSDVLARFPENHHRTSLAFSP